MVWFKFIFILVSVVLKLSDGVKVDMKGSLTLGKEIVNALKGFVNKSNISGRRSLGGGHVDITSVEETENDAVALVVHASFLCREIEFCKGDSRRILNKYIIELTKAVESVFDGLISDMDRNNNQNTLKAIIFEGELKRLIREIKKMLRNVNHKITEKNESYMWIDLLKRINAKFQDTAIMFAAQRLEGNVQEITGVRNKLTQKLVIATTLIELQFVNHLCNQHKICSDSHEVTKALNTLLVQMNTVSEGKAKEFIRHFYETLPGTNFYYRISDVTGHEFQTILHDMAYGDNISTKNVLAIVQRIVEERLSSLDKNKTREDIANGRDSKLVHVMLSDMDHFYSKHKTEPFHDFLSDFFEWTKRGTKFISQLRRVMKDIQNGLSFEADELVYKLVNEMRVFMEITVDPEP